MSIVFFILLNGPMVSKGACRFTSLIQIFFSRFSAFVFGTDSSHVFCIFFCLYAPTYGTLSLPSMNSLYTLGAAASIEAVESKQSSRI